MRWIVALFFFALTFAVAFFGARFQPGSWYAALDKPSWTPPNAVFGPVWTLLYVLMALAAWLVWKRLGWRAGALPLGLYFGQLALNGAWSWLFFGAHLPGWAFADIVLLWLAIVATAVAFWPASRAAALMLMPYLVWVSYAAALNLALWRMNPAG